MILSAHFYMLNDDFSPEYAEANFEGKESENNPAYEWEDELELSEGLENIIIERKGIYLLQGEKNDETFTYELPHMFKVRLIMTNGVEGALVVSESILDSYDFNVSDEKSILNVYLKDYEPLANPLPGVYIATKEFPNQLITE